VLEIFSATPSSVAFSTIKSVRDFLIGEKNNQTSGGAKDGRILLKHRNLYNALASTNYLCEPFTITVVKDQDMVADFLSHYSK
jgi:hypothetical protein